MEDDDFFEAPSKKPTTTSPDLTIKFLARPAFFDEINQPMQVRLQKLLSQAGVTSQAKGRGIIHQGRVRVNGKVVDELGTKRIRIVTKFI